MTFDVEVVGLGLAGSTVALRLAEEGFRVTAYDPVSRYEKACGEQVTLEPQVEEVLRRADVIKVVVRRVRVLIDGVVVTDVELRGQPKWVIVDKPRLVAALREEAKGLGVSIVRSTYSGVLGGRAVTIDARGPYGVDQAGTILAVRLIARVGKWDPEEAWLDFRPSDGGLVWVFPYDPDGRLVNAGAGFLRTRDAGELRRTVETYLRERLGQEEVVDVKGAPIAAFSRPSLHSGMTFRVGEAAGLVMAWSGEGNRPAIESSLFLAEALARAGTDDLDRARLLYSTYAADLLRMAVTSRALTLLAVSHTSSKALMKGMPRWFWELYVRQELTTSDVLESLVEGLREASRGD